MVTSMVDYAFEHFTFLPGTVIRNQLSISAYTMETKYLIVRKINVGIDFFWFNCITPIEEIFFF